MTRFHSKLVGLLAAIVMTTLSLQAVLTVPAQQMGVMSVPLA